MASLDPAASVHLCQITSGTDELRGKRLTYEAVKRLVLAAGRFSVFEATATMRHAKLFEQLERDPALTITRDGFPWVTVKLKPPRPPRPDDEGRMK